MCCPHVDGMAYQTDHGHIHCGGHNTLISSTPEPYHMSILSGQGWVEELFEGHPA